MLAPFGTFPSTTGVFSALFVIFRGLNFGFDLPAGATAITETSSVSKALGFDFFVTVLGSSGTEVFGRLRFGVPGGSKHAGSFDRVPTMEDWQRATPVRRAQRAPPFLQIGGSAF